MVKKGYDEDEIQAKPYNPRTSEQVKYFLPRQDCESLENKIRNHFVQNKLKSAQADGDESQDKRDKLQKQYKKFDWNTLHGTLIDQV